MIISIESNGKMAKIHFGNLGQKLTRERTLWVNNKVGRFSRSAIFDFITVRTSNKDLLAVSLLAIHLGHPIFRLK